MMMFKERLTSLIAIALVGVVLTGCTSKKAQPTDTGAESAPPATTQTSTEPTGPADFDASGNPLDPRTGGLLNRVFYFDYDKSDLHTSDLAVLEIHAQLLNRNRDRTVVIEGHCDERGTREYNLALGERRANAIRNFLTSAGVASSQIETVSYGEERPENPGHDESAWSRNRRGIVNYR
ncbi:MAG: peptidoglycan-associated lipoprotein Pal [Pseudomonadales bacterium]|nr:peptidoglycan-associated lipoprotein Pal [Pseudomonadales bacterium]MCP5184551.1 peptidoglycan-associated lipoprotein Pal [Pseudomonadales bacterium]